ncbi:MAG TPA: hypothetical protein DEB09_02230 [Candidatus Magasanikbacteria bacterium]|nr:hypothetical protein [Candidatus Magasanikbacteria bacterium]
MNKPDSPSFEPVVPIEKGPYIDIESIMGHDYIDTVLRSLKKLNPEFYKSIVSGEGSVLELGAGRGGR